MTHWIHPQAELELGDAAVYYATHASPAIAEAFLAEYERVRDLVIENQQRGPHTDGGLRVYHFDRFPYTLVYEETKRVGHRSTPSHTKVGSRAFGAAEPREKDAGLYDEYRRVQ